MSKTTSGWQIYKQELSSTAIRFDQNENIRLEEKFRLDDLRLLEEVFANHNLRPEEADQRESGRRKYPVRRRKPKPTPRRAGNLTLQEFQNVLSELFGSQYWDDHMELLFNKVDTSCDGFIDWGEFCTYMLLQYKEKDYMTTRKVTFLGQPLLRRCPRNKQEPTSKMLAITCPPPLWFVSISKGGVLTAWDAGLHPQKSYEIITDSRDLQVGKRRFKSWTTDAVYMPNVHKIAMATTSRDIHFFDVSTMNIFEEFHLFALNHVPTAFYYWYNAKAPGNRSLLLWGDDNGAVNLLWLLKPHTGVFEKPFTQQPGPQKIYMQEIKDHSNLLNYQSIPDVHPEAITKLLYVPGQDLIITSSGSDRASVVIMDITRKGKVYTWKINKGVRCFDYCKTLNLLATGGLDHKVRLWNQYVPNRPIAVLPEHTMAILDVAIYEPLRQIFSFSKDSVLKVWDISSHSCLQTLVLRFPCVQPGRVQEQGDFPFLLVQQSSPRLLVAYADYIGMLRLARVDPDEETLVTHEAPLSGVLYNAFFHQVVTGSEDSTIAVWDVETGTKCLLLNNVHGREEITCMAFDKSQRKLITGARNGTLKIWNVQNGHNLHRLQAVEDAEVTCILPLREHKFLTVGWNRKIVIYDTTQMENMYVSADDSWKGGQVHREDILTADFCPSLGLLATASFDGEIIVWNTETQRLYQYLRRCHHTRQPSKPHMGSAGRGGREDTGRPGSKYRQKRPSSEIRSHAPVDKVIFLQQRATTGAQKDAAILISSEAGTLRWWSVFDQRRQFGHFYAPNNADESVFGLSSNGSNSTLVTGDTSGCIQVWDISDYGLQGTAQTQEQRPPLLFCWRAHDGTVVAVEYFLFDAEPFVTSASSDRTAKLWTFDGKYVGTFGQTKSWNLRNPATYQHNIVRDSLPKAEMKVSRNPTEQKQVRVTEQRTYNTKNPQRYIKTGGVDILQAARSHAHPSESMGPGLGAGSQPRRETDVNDREAVSGGRMQEGLMKKMAARKERRHLAADIDVNKLTRFGHLCSPFQALPTSEVQEFTLPANLPPTTSESIAFAAPAEYTALHATCRENPRESSLTGGIISPTLHGKTPLFPPLHKRQRSNVV